MILALLAACAKPPLAPQDRVAVGGHEARIQQIPPADSQKFAGMRDMKAWRNPYLIIRVDGVGLLDIANNEQQIVDPDKLPETLARLPGSAWPYGRVVAIQEIRASSSEEDRLSFAKTGRSLPALWKACRYS